MKNPSQITFEFQDPPDAGENPGVGVRIKTLKKAAQDLQRDPASQPLPSIPAEESIETNTELLNIRLQEFNIDDFSDIQKDASDNTIKDELPDLNEVPKEEAIATDEVSRGESIAINTVASKSTRGRKSLKTMDEGFDLINVPPDEVLFQKQYYAIGEVAEMFHVNQSLLRFWETEFDIIQPRKNRKGDRHFRPIDIKNLLLIHDLLRRRKLTIEGAKDFLKKNKRSPERFAMIQSLQKIKGFLLEIKATL